MLTNTKGRTFAAVRTELRALGITLNKCDDGEFAVTHKNEHKDCAYYTSDLDDARNTGRAMAEWAAGNAEVDDLAEQLPPQVWRDTLLRISREYKMATTADHRAALLTALRNEVMRRKEAQS